MNPILIFLANKKLTPKINLISHAMALTLTLLPLHASAQTSVNEQILNILLQNKLVTQEKYQALQQQSIAEEQELLRLKEIEKKFQAAQVKDSPAATNNNNTAGNARANFKKGFYLETPDGKNNLLITGRFQGDYITLQDDNPGNDSFVMRRARMAMMGTVSEYYDFMMEADFGQGRARLNDSYFNINYVPYAQLLAGQFKTPFSMEELHSDNWIDFVERSLANNFVPSRDLGLMLHGKDKNDWVHYQLAILNGRKINASEDADDHKDIAGRISIAPFSQMQSDWLQPLHLAASFTSGMQQTEHPSTDWWRDSFKTAAGTTFLQLNPNISQQGDRIRTGYELAWLPDSLSVKAEYIDMSLDGVSDGTQTADFNNQAGYVSAAYFLTGEHEPWKDGIPQRITPKHPFTLGKGGWGALQLLARHEWVDFDREILNLGFANDSLYTNGAEGYTLGINWYPSEMVRFMLNYYDVDYTDTLYSGGVPMEKEQAYLSRFEIVW